MPLVLVPTPLGNLRDITLRALDVLRTCDLIVAEDTRTARRLLSAHGISGKPLWSYREQNAESATAAILERARAGVVALVTDAGMPAISDPGRDLVAAARAAAVAIEVLPGPSAFVCAAVLSGFALDGFSFQGFVPRAAGERRQRFERALASGGASVWYESPHRIVATLGALAEIAPGAPVFLVRELSKVHEQQLTGTPGDVARALERPVRGEISFVLEARRHERETASAVDVDAAIDAALARGASVAQAAKIAAHAGADRADAYRRASERRRATPQARDSERNDAN